MRRASLTGTKFGGGGKRGRAKIFNDREFFDYIEKLNREANEIFDSENYQENFFKDKFGI